MDAFIRQSLKNWASDNQPQQNSRARLLLVAAAIQREQFLAPKFMEQEKEMFIPRRSPVDQAVTIYNLPWLWVAQISLTPIRSVT